MNERDPFAVAGGLYEGQPPPIEEITPYATPSLGLIRDDMLSPSAPTLSPVDRAALVRDALFELNQGTEDVTGERFFGTPADDEQNFERVREFLSTGRTPGPLADFEKATPEEQDKAVRTAYEADLLERTRKEGSASAPAYDGLTPEQKGAEREKHVQRLAEQDRGVNKAAMERLLSQEAMVYAQFVASGNGHSRIWFDRLGPTDKALIGDYTRLLMGEQQESLAGTAWRSTLASLRQSGAGIQRVFPIFSPAPIYDEATQSFVIPARPGTIADPMDVLSDPKFDEARRPQVSRGVARSVAESVGPSAVMAFNPAIGTAGIVNERFETLLAQGVEPERAAAVAATMGTVEAAIEYVQVGKFASTFTGLTGAWRSTAGKAALERLTGTARKYAPQFAAGLTENTAQELVQDTLADLQPLVAEAQGAAGPGEVLAENLALENVVNTAAVTAGMMLIFGAPAEVSRMIGPDKRAITLKDQHEATATVLAARDREIQAAASDVNALREIVESEPTDEGKAEAIRAAGMTPAKYEAAVAEADALAEETAVGANEKVSEVAEIVTELVGGAAQTDRADSAEVTRPPVDGPAGRPTIRDSRTVPKSLAQEALRVAEALGVEVRVVQSVDEVPAPVRETFESRYGYPMDLAAVPGFFEEGVAYVTPSAVRMAGGIEATVIHEAIGHGLERTILDDPDFVALLDDARVERILTRAGVNNVYQGETIRRAEVVARTAQAMIRVADGEAGVELTADERALWRRILDWVVARLPGLRGRISDLGVQRMIAEALVDARATGMGEGVSRGTSARFATGALLAPNGKPSNLNPRQWAQVRTPEFKAWFGDWENDPANASKVVDENGEPKIMFHGTGKPGFSSFVHRSPFSLFGPGYYFTDSKDIASEYAGPESSFSETSGAVYPVFLNSRNPFRVGDPLKKTKALALFRKIVGRGKGDDATFGDDATGETVFRKSEEVLGVGAIIESEKRGRGRALTVSALNRIGFDSIRHEGGGRFSKYDQRRHDVVIVTNPMQIKSATANVGTFDAGNPDIRFAVSRTERAAAVEIARGIMADTPATPEAVRAILPDATDAQVANVIALAEDAARAARLFNEDVASELAVKGFQGDKPLLTAEARARRIAERVYREGRLRGVVEAQARETIKQRAKAERDAELAGIEPLATPQATAKMIQRIKTREAVADARFSEKIEKELQIAQAEVDKAEAVAREKERQLRYRERAVEREKNKARSKAARTKQNIDEIKLSAKVEAAFRHAQAESEKAAAVARERRKALERAQAKREAERSKRAEERRIEGTPALEGNFDPASGFAEIRRLTEAEAQRRGYKPDSPEWRVMYRKTLANALWDMSRELNPSTAREQIAEAIGKLGGPGSHLATTEKRAAEIAARIERAAVRQDRGKLIGDMKKLARRYARGGTELQEKEKRRISPETQRWLSKFVLPALNITGEAKTDTTPARKASEVVAERIEEIEDALQNDAVPKNADWIQWHEDMLDELEALNTFGALAEMPLGEVQDAFDLLTKTVAEGRREVETARAERKQRLEGKRATLLAALDFGRGKVPQIVREKMASSAVKPYPLQDMLRDIARWAPDGSQQRKAALELLDGIAEEISDATYEADAEERAVSEELRGALERIYGTVSKGANALLVPREEFRKYSRLGDKRSLDQLLQEYASFVQDDIRAQAEATENKEFADQYARFQAISKELSPKDRALLEWARDFYGRSLGPLSDVHRRITGARLRTSGPSYVPVARKNVGKVLAEVHITLTTVPKFTSARVSNNRPLDESAGLLQLFASRAKQTAQYKAFGEMGIELRGLLNHPDVAGALTDVNGPEFTKRLGEHVLDVLTDGAIRTITAGSDTFRHLYNYSAVTILLWNARSAIKQTVGVVSLANEIGWLGVFAENKNVPGGLAGTLGSWVASPAEQAAAIVDVATSENFKSRFGDGNSAAVAQLADRWALKGVNLYKRIGLNILQAGDMAGLLVTAPYIYRSYLNSPKARGMSASDAKQYALNRTFQIYDANLQSRFTKDQSYYVRRGGAFASAVLAFKGPAMLAQSKEIRAAREVLAHPKSRERWARFFGVAATNKTAAVAFAGMGILLKAVLFDDPPDDDDMNAVISTAIIGQAEGWGFAGAIAAGITDALVTGDVRRAEMSIPAAKLAVDAVQMAELLAATFDEQEGNALKEADKALGQLNPLYRDISKAIKEND